MSVRPIIAKMLSNPGLYLLTDPRKPGHIVPIYVDQRNVAWSLQLDSPLDPEGWLPGNEIHGPLTPDSERLCL